VTRSRPLTRRAPAAGMESEAEAVAAGQPASSRQRAAGGPALFLTKTHQMVEEASTDEVISWAEQGRSFVVWKPVELARDLLPLYFKHCNFSSFVRQLNTYVSFHSLHSHPSIYCMCCIIVACYLLIFFD